MFIMSPYFLSNFQLLFMFNAIDRVPKTQIDYSDPN